MKQLQIFILTLIISFNTSNATAQISDNPIDVLSEKLLQNELLTNRFLKNFVFIKTNTFKKKALADMDKSIALFDDNLSYIILHLPYDRKVKEDFLKLQNFWNIYRVNITDFEKDKYKSLVIKTQRFGKYIKQLNKDIFNKHPEYPKYKKRVEIGQLAVYNGKKNDEIAIAYVLKYAINFPELGLFDIDLGAMRKKLKKIGKFKHLNPKAKALIPDLKTTLESVSHLLEKEKFNPKMIYAYDYSYTNKTFKLLKYLFQTTK